MNDIPEVRVAMPEEKARLISTLVLGFASDPLARWVVGQAHDYLTAIAEFFELFGGKAFEHDSAYVANDGQAVALWLPPGVEPDGESMAALMTRTTSPDRLDDLFSIFAGMDSYHPHEDCWYLPLIAADPNNLGLGLGSALMKHALARCDAEGLPAYLESSNERNVSLYEKFGFEVMGEIQHGTSPVVRPMYRERR
ncbi:MAG: GNAT family N-acetyltransferase [Pseudomonadales bacterium]